MAEIPPGAHSKKTKRSILLLREQIARLLLLNNRSQSQLADHLGVARSWVSKLLRGRRDMVSMRYLDEIAQYFGVEVSDLFAPVKEAAIVQQYRLVRPGERLKELAPRNPKGMGPRPRGKHHTVIEQAVQMLSARQPQKAAKGR